MKPRKTVITRAFLTLCVFISFTLAAQTPRYVDPALDLQNLPTTGGALSAEGIDDQIIRFRNWAALYPA